MAFLQGAGIGLVVGFILGFLSAALYYRKKITPDLLLAWSISVVWLFWHIGAGFDIFGVVKEPPAMFDIIAGGSVGFILGEKFFDYISGSIGKVLKK